MRSLRPFRTFNITHPLLFIFILSICTFTQAFSQKYRQNSETVPPRIAPASSWWNLLHYTINITPDHITKTITGSNKIEFSALQSGRELQIDLQEPMTIESISWRNTSLPFKKDKNDSYIITFPNDILKGSEETITVTFKGKPQESHKPPFDNGWIWATDQKGRPWMSIACEGSGASIWLPCKDVLYDEPDNGTTFSITVADTLTAVANGRLQEKKTNHNGTSTYTWKVTSPINNYNIIPYIGKYVTWHENYAGIKGKLDCDYWVLDYNLPIAQKHLKQTDTMLHAFEYWMGPYPFYKDSYKLVEAPMPGMEHQSAVAYGNGFQNGYGGKDFISGTGWGLKWDFILVHESGHEWFGNSITASSGGETWIHEGFTKYLETLYTDYAFGKQAGNTYALGTWKRIKNDKVIIGNDTPDKYYKGSAMLHMIRQIIGDAAFRGWFKKLNSVFYHHTVSTEQILTLLNDYTKKDFTPVFNQYLRTTQVPTLDYYFQGNVLNYRWSNCVDGFAMPLKVSFDSSNYKFIYPTTKWHQLAIEPTDPKALLVDSNFYVNNKVLTQF
jgi:aminopeptidase N